MSKPHAPQASRLTRHRPRPGGPSWQPDLRSASGPVYRAIVDVMEGDIVAGRLGPGSRLPSQRALAHALGVNLTTVTRAMREAERRGLVMGTPGSGTFVAPRLDRVPDWPSPGQQRGGADFVDLSLNYPPDVAEADLAQALAEWAAGMARRPQECRSLLPYRANQGAASDRTAATEWIAARGLEVDPGRLVICSGAQHGLGLSLAALAQPGDTILCEALAYPGLRAVAANQGLRLVPVALDADGLRPAALSEALRRHDVRALVCTPTLHNPSGVVTSLSRRRELARILRRAGIWVVEDDVYGALSVDAPPSFASLLPERTVYLTSLSKTVAPGLRVGYMVAPDATVLDSLLGALRSSSWMTAPLLAAIASSWIRGGEAERAVRKVRSEIAGRRRTARKTLRPELLSASGSGSDGQAPHMWIALADAATEARAVALLNQAGVGVTAGEAFRVGATASWGFRICLGAARSPADLTRALGTINEVLEGGGATRDRMVL